VTRIRRLTSLTGAIIVLCVPPPVRAADPLPALTIDLPQTSVSGLSSGAYMAGQFHVAFSSILVGVGMVAGGPYGCAEGQLWLALNRCMQMSEGEPDPAALLAGAQSLAATGSVDPMENLADDRVYVFAGTADQTVLSSVGARIPEFYALAGVPAASIRHDATVNAGHAFITENGPVPCVQTREPFVNDCDIDQAGVILEHIYGALQPPATEVHAPIEFSQAGYLASPEAKGMAATGWAYVPASCVSGTTCRVHIAFHGCKQTFERVGDAYTAGTGFNRWAESNNIVVLYPQAHETPGNPNACWDWWGYTDQRYATRDGMQLAAVRRMLLALAGEGGGGGEFCARHDAWNYAHWLAGRAVVCGFGFACAAGSGDLLGTFFTASTVYEHPASFYTVAACRDE
jgi:poly(3-hydroxybutyrate) depolymerase